jgi:subfamily B ATP-binding cassette protein MsbA
MTDAEGIRNLVGSGLVQLLGGSMTAVIALVVLFRINTTMTLACLVMIAVFGGTLGVVFKRVRPIFRERGAVQAEVTGRLGESFGGIRVVKAYRAERRENRTFAKGAHKLFRLIAKTITSVSAVEAAATTTTGLIGALIIYMGGQAVNAGTMTVGDLVMYVFFTGLLAMPVIQLASIGTQVTEAIAGLDRIGEVRRLATEEQEDENRKPLSLVKGDVAFEDVSFEYEAGKPVLEGISFSAPAGTTTALVGRSGSGKSTLIGLLLAFHRPTSGAVLVDGHDVETIRLGDYRRNLGVVLQENFLFDGTIADNIGFSRPGATRAEIEAAARTAYCNEFVDPLEEGYDTLVGERGVRLSGGQRQRLAIARAILADPRILILDEATSALDSESEAFIQMGLAQLREGRTTFVIAHRLSTIRTADQILVLDQGKIVDRGTHDELLARGGLYQELWDRQQGVRSNQFLNPGEEGLPREE